MNLLKEDVKAKLLAPSSLEKPDMIETSKLNYITEEINSLKFQLQNTEAGCENKLK